ncbi:ArnT family glycosyltransferase [Oleidesulfovibrio sp.]|uniref:ArnT family glycosyltransferase n=1 Tax=Oleidesulfovibrio sp. TaxID=2909707 RepID=UPI003A8AA0BB
MKETENTPTANIGEEVQQPVHDTGDKPQDAAAAPQRTVCERILDILAFQPLIPLTILLVLQTVFLVDARALWYSDEVRYANVFEHVSNFGKWIVLHLNGVPYPDKPPVYFWLLAGVQQALEAAGLIAKGAEGIGPRLFFTGAAVSALLYLWATYALARAVAGVSKRVAFGAGLVLLSVFYFIGVSHYSRMDLLFATLITLSHICLFKGWQKDKAMFWVVSGFAFAAVATLTKGPLGLAFPIVTSVLFLLWRGKPRRLAAGDVAIGFGVMVTILLAWVMGAYLTEAPDFLHNIFHDQIYRRATQTWHHAQPWWHYMATLPAAWLPWTLILPVLPFGYLLTKKGAKAVAASRTPQKEGMAYIWIAFLSGFIILSAVSIKIIIYLLPLFAPLAVLTASGVLALSQTRAKWLMRLLALLLVILAGALVTLQLGQMFQWEWLTKAIRWPLDIDGLWILGGVCALGAAAMWVAAPKAGGAGALLVAVLFATIWIQPLGLITAPSLDKVMSPRDQGILLGNYIKEGYTPVTYKVYSGTYTYYAGKNLIELDEWTDFDAAVAEAPKVVVAMRSKHWDKWENKPVDMTEVNRQWIVDQEYVVGVRVADKPAVEDNVDSGTTDAPEKLLPEHAAPAANATSNVIIQEVVVETAGPAENGTSLEALGNATMEKVQSAAETALEAVTNATNEAVEALKTKNATE